MGPAPQAGGASIQDHARFFDHLVDLVPAKYYYDDQHQHLNPRFLAKAAREAAKAEMKAQYKQNKRAKLDPDQAVTALELQKKKLLDSQSAQGTSGVKAAQDGAGPSTSQPASAAGGANMQLQLSGGGLSRQELLEKLHQKIEDARARRKASAETAEKAKEWRQKALQDNVREKQLAAKQQHKQQQQQQGAAVGGKRKAADGSQQQQQAGKGHQGPDAKRQKGQQQQHGPAAGGKGAGADFQFTRLELDQEHGKGARGPKRAPKEVLLKQAEARKAEKEALAATQEGKAKLQADAWQTALARAKGDKVLDDPKLLKRSLKKDAKKREKAGKAWRERTAAQAEAQQARQSKRKGNLDARRQTKLDNKKAKREKKLLRPGFEGRKEGFITPKAAGGAGAGKS